MFFINGHSANSWDFDVPVRGGELRVFLPHHLGQSFNFCFFFLCLFLLEYRNTVKFRILFLYPGICWILLLVLVVFCRFLGLFYIDDHHLWIKTVLLIPSWFCYCPALARTFSKMLNCSYRSITLLFSWSYRRKNSVSHN